MSRAGDPTSSPRIERLADGTLHVAYHVHADSAKAYGLSSGHAVSEDDGRIWRAVAEPPAPGGVLLRSGDRLLADSAPSRPVASISLPDPVAVVHASYVDYAYYRPQDLPDGSLGSLLRTADGNGIGPLYWSRSEDGGRTWAEPHVFDDCGVWPQLLTLETGVTLAAYGRPGLS